MKENEKIDGFLLALMICLTITALFVVLHVANQNKIEMEQNYEREHFAPMNIEWIYQYQVAYQIAVRNS